jgi:diguanylate cyclase (GGDEF)-like protein/PAS domain S-box-containing protein
MIKPKLFSLFTLFNKKLELKIVISIFLVALVFLPITSIVSYRHTFTAEQDDALQRVERLIAVVQSNAAVAAYLSDFSLATEIINGLGSAPEIKGVIFTLSSGVKLTNGDVRFSEKSDIHIDLKTKFDQSEFIGSMDVFINNGYINEVATDKGVSLVTWQVLLVLILIVFILVIFRFFISIPIRKLVDQIHNIQVGKISSHHLIAVESEDEIGFLAENMNLMIQKIHSSYALDAEKNAKISHLEKQFRMIFEYSHAGIALINAQNKVLISNQAFESVFSHPEYKFEKGGYYAAIDLVEDSSLMEDVIQQVRDNHKNIFKDFKVKNKADVWIRALFSVIEDKQGELGQFVEMVVYDISDRARIEKHFEYNASHDALTGLLNRRGGQIKFNEQLIKAQATQSVFILVLLDLNDFKPVNDKYGHEAGDIVLKEISARLRSTLRPDDVIIRWGGDEFVISMVLIDLSRLHLIIEEIQESFFQPIHISSEITVQIGASIGVSTSKTQGYDITSLLETADDIMYEVKRNGKGRYRIHREEVLSEIVRDA